MFEALVPLAITDATLLSSSATVEDPGRLWVAGESYAEREEVWRPTTHKVYRSATAGVSNTPPEQDPTRWQVRRATNLWAQFDARVASVTKLPSPYTVTLKSDMANALVLLGLDGAWEIEVTYRESQGGPIVPLPGAGPSGVLVQSLEASQPADWWEYYFMPLRPARDFLLRNIEPYVDGVFTVTLRSGGAGDISVGLLAIGDLRPLGQTQWGARSKTVDYSYIDISPDDGSNVIVKGPGARDISCTAFLEPSEANAVERTLDELRGNPCVVIGSNLPEHEGLRTFGLLTGEVSYDNKKGTQLIANVKGLV